jgi:hypothetical protein
LAWEDFMANCNPPVKNQAFDLGFTLYKSDGSVIANPGTLTAKISKDFGDYADIGTTSEEDTTYGQMKAALTATEMNADVVMLYIKDDTAGCVPFTATIYTCSATRGLAGTALPNAAADAAGGLPISDAGGLDLDTYIKRLEAAFTSTIAGYLDAAISTRAPETGGALAGLATTVGVAGAGLTAITGAKLHADYDAAKTAASQTSVNDIPTNTELATAFTEIKGATWAAETDTLEALRDRGDAAWVTATGFAVAGDKMDLVDAPNATALVAMAVALLDTLLSEGDADALNARTVRSALRAIRNKSGTVGGTLTVCKEDDTAAAWTAAVTEDASAEPITEIDPA